MSESEEILGLPWMFKQCGKYIGNEPYNLCCDDEYGTTSSSIKDSNGSVVCIVPEAIGFDDIYNNRQERLEYIVRAANNHHQLVATVKEVVERLRDPDPDADAICKMIEDCLDEIGYE